MLLVSAFFLAVYFNCSWSMWERLSFYLFFSPYFFFVVPTCYRQQEFCLCLTAILTTSSIAVNFVNSTTFSTERLLAVASILEYFHRKSSHQFEHSHCIKSVHIRSYPGPHFPRIFPHSDWIGRDTQYLSLFSPNAGKCGENADQNNSEYEPYLRSVP